MTPYVTGFDEHELGLACLSFVSRAHFDDIASRGPDAVYRSLAGDRGIDWARFLMDADFRTDPLLSRIMVDRAINPITMAVEAFVNNEWTKRHFDADRMSDADIYHLYRMRHFSIVHGAMVPRNRLAVDLMIANRHLAGACWEAFNDLKPVDFASEDAMMTPDHLVAILKVPAVRQALLEIAGTLDGIMLRPDPDVTEGTNAKHQLEGEYRALTGLALSGEALH
jgi:hypothetical protein